MKKILIIIFLFKVLSGALVPTPFITDPEAIQRAGFSFTEQYFDVKLFKKPYGIAFSKLRNTSPQGEIIIGSDCAWHRLIYICLEEDGGQSAEWMKAFGEFGNGAGEFDVPMGLCIDTTIYSGADDEYIVYVADKVNDRVVKLKYDVSAEEISYIGTIGSSLSNPTDVASVTKDNGAGAYVAIVEQGNHRLSLYETYSNGSSSLIQRYGTRGPGIGQFNAPQGIAICNIINEPGVYYIYVTDKGNNRIVCLRFQPGQGITWVRDYKKMGNCGFYSVTTSQYYCVYVTAFYENKIYVFTQGLTELLYEYGNANLLNGPKDIYIDWDRLGLTENWTASTGIQYFKIIPEIREFYPEPDGFDATDDSAKINFRVDETAQYLTMTVADRNLFEDSLFVPERYSVWWDGRDSSGQVVLPDTYEIKIYYEGQCLATTTVRVKGTKVQYYASGHWQTAGNPYVLVGSCGVPGNDSLIIEPNVLVMGHGPGAGIYAGGIIKTLGNVNDSTIFTAHRKLYPPDSVYPGIWGGVTIKHLSSLVHYCRFEYASTGINIQPTTVADSIFEHCLSYSNTVAAKCWFTGAGGFGDGNAYLNNETNKIQVESGDLRNDMAIKPQVIPYWFKKVGTNKEFKVYVDADSSFTPTLIIQPGTHIEFEDSTVLRIGKPSYWDSYLWRWFYFRGRLVCEGTESDTIRLTLTDAQTLRANREISRIATATASPRNDNRGLLTDSLFWRGIRFEGLEADTSKIKYTSIEYAGLDTAAIIFGDSININITDSRIYKSKEYGIWLAAPKPKDNFTIANCLFEEDSLPIRTSFNNLNGIHTCLFSNNKINAIEVLNNDVRKNLTIHYQPVPYHFLKASGWGKRFLFADDDTCHTLTIKPGAKILFGDSTALWIGKWTSSSPGSLLRGRIISQGTEDSMIVFSALDTTKYWRGIRFYTSTSDTSRFKYCEISYGGQDYPGSEDYCKANLAFGWSIHNPCTVEDCQFLRSYSFGCGDASPSGGSASLVRNNYFSGNDSFPLVICANDLDQSIDNTFENNKYEGIVITGGITHSFTMQNQGVPYVIMKDNFDINGQQGSTTCLEIESGNILKFKGKTAGIGQYGVLKARGTTFTAYDNNWWGMKFDNSNQDTSILDSCIIEKAKYYGGYWPQAAIEVVGSYLRINNSYIVNNEKGIALNYPPRKVWLSGNLIAQNNCGMASDWNWPSGTIYIKNNDFCGNKVAITRTGGDNVAADFNWWGDVSGPWDPSPGAPDYNPLGQGDSIGDNIIYRPWLTAPFHPSVVTLIQPNGEESLYCETEYQIRWSRSVIPLKQELYYTTDYPEGSGDKGEFCWIFIDTVAVSETSYVWQVPYTLSERCRVAVGIYYKFGKKQIPKSKLQTNYDTQMLNTDATSRMLNSKDEYDLRDTKTISEIASSLEMLGARNDTRLLDDYEYELRPTNTIMVAVDISNANFSIGPPEYTLTIHTVGQGTVNKNPDSVAYTEGTVCTLTAVPDSHWVFSHWSDSLSGNNNPETITMNSDKTVTATFIASGHVLNLDSFPMYQADSLPGYKQKCGPAVAQMALNYMFWNNITDSAGPPMLPEFEQDLLYTYGIDHNSDPESVYFDLQGMWYTIQDKKPMPYSEYGYNFSKRHSANQDTMLKFICQWIDYTVGTYGGHKNGYPYHVPSIVPAYGDYTNWMAIRGIHTDTAAYPMPDTLTIYGFWVNDPYPFTMGGIGEKSYKIISDWNSIYYLSMTVGDYIGEYVAVLEPPMSVEGCHLIIAEPKPRFTSMQISELMNIINPDVKPINWIVQAAIDGVTEELIPYDKKFEELFVKTTPGKPLFVKSIKGNDYYIVPFRFNNLTPQITKDRTINVVKITTKVKTISDLKDKSKIKPHFSNAGISSQVRTMALKKPILIEAMEKIVVVILIDASDGHFKEAAWTDIPVKYLPISRGQAQQIAIAVAEELDLGINATNDLQPELIHRKSSPYYPEWCVVIGEYAIYISQDGTISIEELSGEGKGNEGVMSNDGSAPLIYSFSITSNPFEKNTTILYSLAKPGHVSLKIYDISGRFVKTLVDEKKSEGIYSVIWNGCDDNNQRVATGVYFISLTSGNFTAVNKVILAR